MPNGDNNNGNGVTFIGRCNFRGNDRIFGIKSKDRRQHMYVVGKTGVGKSVLLKNLALQDIRAGKGVAIIDPHGEFVEDVLEHIPPERVNDVIYFNPVDSDFPLGFNVLEVPDAKYKHLVVSDLLGIFTKIWANVWSARMEYILQNCIMALLDTPGTTLLGIPRLLVDKDYRQKIVANVKDPVVKSFWVHEFETWRDQFRNEAIVPIQNKVNQFLNTSFIRNIVGQAKSSMNIPEIMNTGKILLVNVSKGRVGEDNSQLLGAMIITKIQLAAMERVRIPEEERLDFYLYVDEFQNFATDSFASILSEARKYRLNIIIAHQYIGQLETDVSTKVKDAVFGNTGTMISFRVGAADAEFLEQEFTPEFMQQDLINLPNYHIYLKLMVDGVTSRPFSATTLPPLQFETDQTIRDRVIKVSRERYARPRAEVEDKISRWSGMMGEGEGGSSSSLPAGQLIETPCWNCGKTATVPFKPDGKRPVYCMDCLKKIEAGTLIPIPERMPRIGREKFSQTLDTIGIEFESKGGQMSGVVKPAPPVRSESRVDQRYSGQSGDRSRDQRRPPQQQSQQRQKPEERRPMSGNMRSTPVVRIQGAKPISLSNLKSREDEVKTPADPKVLADKPADKKGPSLKDMLAEVVKQAQTPAPEIKSMEPEESEYTADKAIAEKKSATDKEKKDPIAQAGDKGKIVKPGETIKF